MDEKARRKKRINRGAYILVMLAMSVIVVKLLWNMGDTFDTINGIFGVVFPFVLGLFIAYLINPLVEFLNRKVFKGLFRIRKKGISKGLSVLFAYAIVISVITTCMFYIVPQIVESLMQMKKFIDSAQTGYKQIVEFITEFGKKYPEWKIESVIGFINEIPKHLEKYLGDIVMTIIPTLYTTSMSLINGILDLVIAIIVSVYMLIDKPKLINNIKKTIYAILPQKKADRLLVVSAECNKIFGNFIIGKMIDSIIIGILCWIAMSVMEMPYALVISVIVGITNMIPYFGPFIGAVPGVLLLLIVEFKYAVMFGILIFILQQFDGLYLGPKILGESTGLRPIWIIFAITVGGSLAGVAGMFLGVPVVAVIAYLINEALDKKIKKKNIIFETDPDTDIISRDTLITEDKTIEE